MKAKILVLFCGGTTVMVKNAKGSLAPPSQEKALESIMAIEPRLFKEMDLEVHFIFNEDSSNMTPAIWDEIAKSICDSYAKFDGFVVIHGTDTMAFTSSALSFALPGIGKPVVFTGAQIPGDHINSDVRLNFVNAVLLASKDISGVMLLFGCSIFHGARVTKISHAKLEGFASVNAPLIGEIGTNMILSPSAPKRHDHPVHLETGFDSRISIVHLFPGVSLDFLTPMLFHGVQGLILIAYGMGNLPKSHLPFLRKAQESEIPVIIRTQCLEGTTCMNTYETGQEAFACGVIEAYDMSLESTVVKLMWALEKKVPYSKMRQVLHQNRTGEIQR